MLAADAIAIFVDVQTEWQTYISRMDIDLANPRVRELLKQVIKEYPIYSHDSLEKKTNSIDYHKYIF